VVHTTTQKTKLFLCLLDGMHHDFVWAPAGEFTSVSA
jgi:hypothetical protein